MGTGHCPICQFATSMQAPLLATYNAALIPHPVECPRCGFYAIDQDLFRQPIREPDVAIRLSGAVRRATDATKAFREPITSQNYRQIATEAGGPTGQDPDELLDHLLLSIASRSRYLGDATPPEPADAWVARLFLPGRAQLQNFIDDMDEDLVVTPVLGENVSFKLTHAGWRRVHEARRRRGPGNQAFVAMWFHAGLDRVFDDGVRPALAEVGYRAYRQDRSGNNDRIDDAMVAEIRRSRLLVADFTGGRPSVYFEAGLAEGLGIPVIWCCNQSWPAHAPTALAPSSELPPEWVRQGWAEQLAFDVRQQPFILWDDVGDLQRQLVQRIRRLGLDLPVAESARPQ